MFTCEDISRSARAVIVISIQYGKNVCENLAQLDQILTVV